MIDSVVLKIKDFILYTDEHFSKAKMQEFRGKFGIVGNYVISRSIFRTR